MLRALAVCLLVCSAFSSAQDHDAVQERINEEAYRNRFKREPFPDEETGIRVAPSTTRDEMVTRPNWKTQFKFYQKGTFDTRWQFSHNNRQRRLFGRHH